MKIQVNPHHILGLIWMARRYADRRSTYAPHIFNGIYEAFKNEHPEFLENDLEDTTIDYFPYAQDGMYDPRTGEFDARPNESSLRKEALEEAIEDEKAEDNYYDPEKY